MSSDLPEQASESVRADIALVKRGLVESRSKAQSLIKGGHISLNDQPLLKAGMLVSEQDQLVVTGQEHPWVSRGGMKLAGAIKAFDIDLHGLTVVDVGASTGGFTDVALSYGAEKIYAVDVGHGQLAEKLRHDKRVVSLEKTNARYLSADHIPERVDCVVCDASFISLQTILPAALDLTQPRAQLVALIKPQFEVGKENVGKGGIVKDQALHARCCDTIKDWVDAMPDWSVIGIAPSPIKGPDGNVEFLLYAQKGF